MMQPIYDPNILWSSNIFTDSKCPCPMFSKFVKIEGAQKWNGHKIAIWKRVEQNLREGENKTLVRKKNIIKVTYFKFE